METNIVADETLASPIEYNPSNEHAGKASVLVSPAPNAFTLDFLKYIDDLLERQNARGHIPMTKEEVDAVMEESRGSYED